MAICVEDPGGGFARTRLRRRRADKGVLKSHSEKSGVDT
jgi:hypothetical protein